MRSGRLIDTSDGRVLVDRLEIADTHVEKGRGLLGRDGLEAGTGLLIPRCRSVHTFGMRFVIDVAYLDDENVVVKTVPALRPWRVSASLRGRKTLELPEGALERSGIVVGTACRIEESAPAD